MKKFVMAALAFTILAGTTALAANTTPADKVKFFIDKWRKPGSNNIGTADVTITNDNDFAVKNVRVQCHYADKAAGKMIETEQNLPVTVKANTKQSFRKQKFPFIDTANAAGSCQVSSATQL